MSLLLLHLIQKIDLLHTQESNDNCQWYAAKASKEPVSDATVQSYPKVVNHNGHISEVDPGKGVILFDFYDEVCSLLKVTNHWSCSCL